MEMLIDVLAGWRLNLFTNENMKKTDFYKINMSDEGRRRPVPQDKDRLAVPEGWESPLTRSESGSESSAFGSPARTLSPGLLMERRKRKLVRRKKSSLSVSEATEGQVAWAEEPSGLTDQDAPFEEVTFMNEVDQQLQLEQELQSSRIE